MTQRQKKITAAAIECLQRMKMACLTFNRASDIIALSAKAEKKMKEAARLTFTQREKVIKN